MSLELIYLVYIPRPLSSRVARSRRGRPQTNLSFDAHGCLANDTRTTAVYYCTDGSGLSFGPCLAVAGPHPCRRYTGALLCISCIWLARIVRVSVQKRVVFLSRGCSSHKIHTGYIELMYVCSRTLIFHDASTLVRVDISRCPRGSTTAVRIIGATAAVGRSSKTPHVSYQRRVGGDWTLWRMASPLTAIIP